MEDKIKDAIEMIKSTFLFDLSKRIERKRKEVVEIPDAQLRLKTINEIINETWDAAITECHNMVLNELESVEKKPQLKIEPGKIIC